MAWTTPTVRATGELMTASIWNTDIVDNLAYLKGEAGVDITLEDDVVPSAGSERVGLATAPWGEGHFDKLYAGPRAALHKFIREVTIEWADRLFTRYQLEETTAGSGGIDLGGFGQLVLKVTNNGVGSEYIEQQGEQDSALDVSWNASRSPYYRQEFAIDRNVADTGIFIGLRQTPGVALPDYTAEHFFGLVWTGAIWVFQTGNASDQDVSGTQTINVATRYVVEFLLIAATSVECYLNGVLIDTLTVVPTGDLDWSVLVETDGGGGATDTHLTLGKLLLQEDLS